MHNCEMMDIHLKEENIIYVPEFREFGIPVLDGGSSFIVIGFCPWCGQKLPSSLRDDWCSILEEKGLDVVDDADKIPEEMLSDEWWKKRKIPM